MMNGKLHPSRFPLPQWALCALAVVGGGCSDPTSFNTARVAADGGSGGGLNALDDCPANPAWLPMDGGSPPAVQMYEPLPHPATECPFYSGGFQNFLIATYPDSNGDPAIASYATIDDAFLSKTAHDAAPAGQHRGTAKRSWLGDIKQAGGREIVIDQNGHTLYYGIHLNQAFVDFIKANGLQTLDGVTNADPNLFFPAGLVEFKSAWMDIDPGDGVTGDYSSYITTMAWVPTLHQDPTTHAITEDRNTPRHIKVALIALHSVYTLPGHPEFIWASIQHVEAGGSDHLQGVELGVHANSAPTTDFNPDAVGDPNNLKVTTVVSDRTDYLLYHAGTPAQSGNQAIPETQLTLNEATQSFPKEQASNIYRQFPGSKSNKIDPDDAITSLNNNWAALVAQNAASVKPTDKRGFYRLVGGQWLDKPSFFKLQQGFQNDETSPLFQLTDANSESGFADLTQHDERLPLLMAGTKPADDLLQNGSDSPFSISAGEDRMSSTAMESFTQSPASFRNCFSCHNTNAINAKGVPVTADNTEVRQLLTPKMLNVSHLFSQFVLEETQ
jgi:hypothetical protein